jgi:hypothetical protein
MSAATEELKSATVEDALSFLTKVRGRFVDITASITALAEGAVEVRSRHVAPDGAQYRNFSIVWSNPEQAASEYSCGLSIVHDVKDHYFYGLGITNLTEFQTIVQTYYGREVAGGCANLADSGGWKQRIERAVHDEFYGPRGSRVYDPSARGLLDIYCPYADDAERAVLYEHMLRICLDIMLPEIRMTYAAMPAVRSLQASTLDRPALVDYYLGRVNWCDRSRRHLRLTENTGLTIVARAYIDDDLSAMSQRIYQAIRAYVRQNDLNSRAPRLFSTAGYLIAKRMESRQEVV